MVKFTKSMEMFLINFHVELIAPLMFGHLELWTDELSKEYFEWLKTDEGKSYLEGGENYKPPC